MLDYENLPRVLQSHPFSKEEIKKYLLEFISPNIIDFNENIIDKFVTQIKVESETEFSWYLRFDVEVDVNLEKKLYCTFTIPFKEALKYRNQNVYIDSLQNALTKCKKDHKDKTIFVIGSFYTYKEVIENLKK